MTATSAAWTSPLLDLLFDDPIVGRCLVAPDGSVLRANAEWLRATGFGLDDVLGEDIVELFPEARDMSLALHARVRAGHHVSVPRHAQRVNGRETWWDGYIDPVPMEGGTGLLITAREVAQAARTPPVPPAEARASNVELLARIRDIADHAPAAVFVKDAKGRYLFVNRWMRELLGLRRGAIIGRTISDIMPPHLARAVEEHDRRVAAGQEVASEDSFPTPGGDRVLMAVRFPFPLGDGSVGSFGIAVDVTDRHRAESALRESEERFRLLAQAMPQIVCVLGPDGRAEYVNPTWVTYSGLDLVATKAAGWDRVLHPDDRAAALECRRRALKLRSPQDVELRYRGADGSFRWFLSRLAPVSEGGRVVRLVGAAMDIEDRKRAEAILREQLALKDQLAKVAASVPGVVCSFRLDPDGSASMPFSAPAIGDLYGLPQAELARDVAPVCARTHPDDLARARDALAASARTMSPWNAEFRYEHPTKGLRWIRGTAIPTPEPAGSVLWHGHVADVTDQVDAEHALLAANEQLREADRRKDEFLGMLSHELRNPLAPIHNSVHVLRHGDAAQSSRALAVIARQAEHLTRLVDDLLDVTRIARGKIHLRPERLDLCELATRTGEDFRALIDDRRIAYRVDIPSAPVWVAGDATRLAQVVGNLLHNASKFTRSGDEVALTVDIVGGEARVRVQDTGAGIDPGLLPNVFDAFVQADRTLARTEGGLGLGLALVKGIVELHGGTVRATSAGHGKGTEFTIRLPLAAPADDHPAPGRGDRHRARSRRVLVVDDNRDAADSLAQLVGILGHDPEVAYDGPAALEKVRAHTPDVVLCDIGLPGMDGYEVARRVRSMTGDEIRLVAVSGYAQPEDVSRAIEAGFDAHVAKPADPEKLQGLLG